MGEPVEVYVFGTEKFRLHKGVSVYYATSIRGELKLSHHMVEIFNEKTGRWQYYPCCEAVLPCPVCGKPMRVYYVPGTTWLALCSKECSEKFDEKMRELGGDILEVLEFFERGRGTGESLKV